MKYQPLNAIFPKKTKLTILVIIVSVFKYAYAQQQQNPSTPFKIRFDTIINGDISTIANNTVSLNAKTPFNDAEKDNHDEATTKDMTYIDIDGVYDANNDAIDDTFCSSSADLINPFDSDECYNIVKAYLYWAAADKEKNDPVGFEPNSEEENQENWNYNDVMLMLPGTTEYITLSAQKNKGEIIFRARDYEEHFNNDPYTCVKDITKLVNALDSPFGTYQVANVESKVGQLRNHRSSILDLGVSNVGTCGGWQIVFVYENKTSVARRISLFDGYKQIVKYETVIPISEEVDININGLSTIENGPVNANIAFGAIEGDRKLDGDQLLIKRYNSNQYVSLSTNQRDTNNFFRSSITVNNKEFLARNPAGTNTLGFDAGIFKLNNPNNTIIGNGQTTVDLKLRSNKETFGIYFIGFSVEVFKPDLSPIVLSTNLGDTSAPIEITPNEAPSFIDLSLTFKNHGNDDAKNTTLSLELPTQLELEEPTLPEGITYQFNTTSRILNFNVDNTLVKSGSKTITINFKLKVKDNCYFLNTDCTNLTFNTQFKATYTGDKNNDKQITLSSTKVGNCRTGNEKPIQFKFRPQAPKWLSKKDALNVKLKCEDLKGLNDAQQLKPNASCPFILKKVSGKFIPDNKDCTTSGKYINTWTFADKCGLGTTIAPFKQVIEIYDNVNPNLNNCSGKLNDLVLKCGTAEDFNQQANKWHQYNLKTLLGCASDNCSAITPNNITSNFNFNVSGAPCTINETVTYSISDGCGNTLQKQLRITFKDTNAPQLSTCPQNLNKAIECSGADFVTEFNMWNSANIAILKQCAKDLCYPLNSSKIISNTTNYQLKCGNTGEATVTYFAEDKCGNTSKPITATFIVKDTKKPFLSSGIISNQTVNCNAIPKVPNLIFKDNCSVINPNDVTFKETKTYKNSEDENFEIIRTWTVKDQCGNTEVFKQRINVITQTLISNFKDTYCFNNGPIILNDYLSKDSVNYNNWKFIAGAKTAIDLKDGIFYPSNIELDSLGLFTFSYTDTFGFCYNNTNVELTIDDNCMVYPCNPDNFIFSKTITPNGDNSNQYFTIKGSRECDFQIDIKIFNRWGAIVYENSNYQNDWSGFTNNTTVGSSGKVTNGTYYYVINLIGSGFKRFTGPIYIGTK